MSNNANPNSGIPSSGVPLKVKIKLQQQQLQQNNQDIIQQKTLVLPIESQQKTLANGNDSKLSFGTNSYIQNEHLVVDEEDEDYLLSCVCKNKFLSSLMIQCDICHGKRKNYYGANFPTVLLFVFFLLLNYHKFVEFKKVNTNLCFFHKICGPFSFLKFRYWITHFHHNKNRMVTLGMFRI